LSWLVLSLLALGLPLAWGCKALDQPPTRNSGSSGSATEAEKTHQMEEKAAEIDRKAEEVRSMEGTEQEKIDAMNSVDQERREATEQGEQGNGQ
jgi:hypothetical protein